MPSKQPKPWKNIDTEKLKKEIRWATRLLLEKTDSSKWDTKQLFYVAKAIAMYKLTTGETVEVIPHEHHVEIRGRFPINVLYKPIQYKGPFTRGYRYVKVNMEKREYKIVKIKKRKVKKREQNIPHQGTVRKSKPRHS